MQRAPPPSPIETGAYFEPGTPFNDQETGELRGQVVRFSHSPSLELEFVNRAVRPFDDGNPHGILAAAGLPIRLVS